MLTVACVLVKGNVDYTPAYVVNLQRMVRRHLKQDHHFVCLTDEPELLPRFVSTIQIPPVNGIPGWWAKVNLFNPRLGLRERTLYLDLDVLVVGSLDAVVEFQSPFAIVPHAGNFKPRNGLEVVQLYNSSVMIFDRGEGINTFTKFGKDVPQTFWGDQDWLATLYPKLDRMPVEWFPRFSEVQCYMGAQARRQLDPTPPDAKVILVKKPKPHDAAKVHGWFRTLWEE